MGSVLRLAMRAAIWRTTPEPSAAGLGALVLCAIALAMVRLAHQFVDAVSSPSFNPYGINALVAWIAIAITVAAFLVPGTMRITALCALVILAIVADVPGLVINGAIALAKWSVVPGPAVSATMFGIYGIWWIGAMLAVFRSIEPAPPARQVLRVAALGGALLVAGAVLPHAPVFVGQHFDVSHANLWEYAGARYAARQQAASDPDIGSADVAGLQSRLLQAEVDHLAPARAGTTNIYAIGVAGWADEDVFAKELDGALAVLGRSLPLAGSLRLVNNRATIDTMPLASRRNFAAAVHAVAERMNKQDDVLILLMTSHGTRDGVALRFPDNAGALLDPAGVASDLDREGIRNRVVIVSACFAGVFVPPLANDNTIVLTAADEQHTSFGCAPERDWTYFGDALFNQAMQPGTDFKGAFDHARLLIAGWERMDGAPGSNPQGYFGATLVQKLQPFFESAAQGAP